MLDVKSLPYTNLLDLLTKTFPVPFRKDGKNQERGRTPEAWKTGLESGNLTQMRPIIKFIERNAADAEEIGRNLAKGTKWGLLKTIEAQRIPEDERGAWYKAICDLQKILGDFAQGPIYNLYNLPKATKTKFDKYLQSLYDIQSAFNCVPANYKDYDPKLAA